MAMNDYCQTRGKKVWWVTKNSLAAWQPYALSEKNNQFWSRSFFVCPTELIAFSDRVEEFRELNAEVLGVSVDSHFSHLTWIKTPRKKGGLEGLDIPLASDLTKKMSRDYGVLHDDGTALRGLFIIDKTLIVRHITINDLPIGRSVDEALRVIKAFQFHEERDVVCPANWQPDSPTIKPEPEKAIEYFDKYC
ncbi:thioredoxin-dependent peroxide reductase, mitochondrial [Caerostris extrusa]|uniref:thioredoxin-dependent peroxiredoxin n=1 Tax=Caerostris extrusa TaxID=172846 RepID=A0AAV4NEY3_CAEEX|nr:thioredoxin-dependent peroxide reductase, mitochondrial [Caerostris extrusa]